MKEILAILARKKCFINSVGKRERVLSQTESLQVSSSLDSTVGPCDERPASGKRTEATLSLGTLRTIFLLFSIQSILQEIFHLSECTSAGLELQNTCNSKGWKLLPGRREGAILGVPATYSSL